MTTPVFAASDNDTVNLATDLTAGPAQHTSLQTLDLDTPFPVTDAEARLFIDQVSMFTDWEH